MRNILILLAFTISFTSAQQSVSIKVANTTRSFILYAPSGLSEKPPLVISMHGLGGSGSFQRNMYSLDNLADREKIIVAYPDGTFKVSGSNGWDISGVSDVNFISAVIDTLTMRYNVDSNRVFATGFSMGGMMSYKLACTITHKIAAIAPASGYPMSKFGYDNICTPSGPVPICHFHGTIDNVVTYSGLEDFVKLFVNSDGCTGSAVSTSLSSKVRKEQWTPCDSGSEIIIYHFDGMDHAYPTMATYGFSPNDTLWNFFKKHPRKSATGITIAKHSTHTNGTVSVSAVNGTVFITGDDPVAEVRITDIQGRSLLTWIASGRLVTHVSFNVKRCTGLCIVNIKSLHGNTVKTVAVRKL